MTLQPTGTYHELPKDFMAGAPQKGKEPVPGRFVGIDVGAETIKVVELAQNGHNLLCVRRLRVEHGKEPGPCLLKILHEWNWDEVQAAAVTGRMSRQVNLPHVPIKQAQARGYRFLFGNKPATIVSIGNHGFSVLELRETGLEVFRENNRCAQGTGNFLRQLVERFGLDVAEASELCADVENPAPLSGRCPVILKTDMTHLVNKGENRARILAGLFDAVCENVMVLIKPGITPPNVCLIGGVSRSRRIQNTFRGALEELGMTLQPLDENAALFMEAMGAAVVAATGGAGSLLPAASAGAHRVRALPRPGIPPLDALLAPPTETKLDRVAALADSLRLVRRMSRPPAAPRDGKPADLILGFDIGSTGSKLVALDAESQEIFWEGYRCTAGDPVGAAQALLREFVAQVSKPAVPPISQSAVRTAGQACADSEIRDTADLEVCATQQHAPASGTPAAPSPVLLNRVLALGVTGSGREIVGSLLATCYGKNAVFILNEIAAHAEGAMHYDRRVDTIFEIGGQDAKYIRLAEGRVIDCAMNEACSAGTGSFIEEQGCKFPGVRDVVELGREALSASCGVSLGQHCSVFMAEIIDEAVAAGVEPREIIAGLYDSIIQNYLHRVKGNRSVGQVIFCQGMPFSADALAAAVARQTGSQVIIPPNPGTVGALGIALLTRRELPWRDRKPLDPAVFLSARIEQKETFHCKANVGCGGAGNKCRIDSIRTIVGGQRQRFTWGGGCSLHDKGTRKKKLPDLAPDPFREREELVRELLVRLAESSSHSSSSSKSESNRGRLCSHRQRVALSDEFMLKGLFPFFATFLHELGFDLVVPTGADQAALKRGIQEANVPFCAPMQLFHGLASKMADAECDFLFVPMIRATPRTAQETAAAVCPIAQASPDILRWDLKRKVNSQVVSPVINIGAAGLESGEFLESCQRAATALGVDNGQWRDAWRAAVTAQLEFDCRCVEIGRRALAFCAGRDIVPVVVLGRPYTIYNKVLNSNVPALLREQGAIGIPVDCYPVAADVPTFDDIYWGYSQRILRAAHQIRHTPGVYSLFCSNYACGPDSFSLHFYSYIMEGKPFAIIETDGHSGDAGTKTRVEAFLYCVEQDRKGSNPSRRANDLRNVEIDRLRLAEVKPTERFLIPLLGPASDVVTACLRGRGYAAETLPMPDVESLRLGRRYTSGKECVPMCMTLGCLLKRIERDRDNDARFVLVMPRTRGPCRFGVYNVLNRITLERLGWGERVAIWSPKESGYFDDTPPGLAMLIFAGFMGADLLLDALHDVRPVETRAGAAQAIYNRYNAQLLCLCEARARGDLSIFTVLREATSGAFFGVTKLLSEAAAEFAAVKGGVQKPTVLVVGEIYVRTVPFANDFIVEKLEARGCKARVAPSYEWLEYVDHMNRRNGKINSLPARLTSFLQRLIRNRTYAIMAGPLGWPPHVPIKETLNAAAPYLRDALEGEAVITLGSAIHEWRAGRIDAAVSVGPLECMPNKVAEAQFFHVTEQEGLLTLTIPVIGDPMNLDTLDNFVFEVKTRFNKRAVWDSERASRLSATKQSDAQPAPRPVTELTSNT